MQIGSLLLINKKLNLKTPQERISIVLHVTFIASTFGLHTWTEPISASKSHSLMGIYTN